MQMGTSEEISVDLLDETTITSIKHFIEMAMKNKMSWTTVSTIIAEMTVTLQTSKQVIKILLQMLQSKVNTNENGKSDSEGEKNVENTNTDLDITYDDSFLKDAETEERINHPQLSYLKSDETVVHDNELKNHKDSLETIKKLVESGEKLYTFVGDADEMTDEEVGFENIEQNDSEQILAKENSHKTKFKCNTLKNLVEKVI